MDGIIVDCAAILVWGGYKVAVAWWDGWGEWKAKNIKWTTRARQRGLHVEF
jgi:hypothetical protein